jgi:hypothetical protein
MGLKFDKMEIGIGYIVYFDGDGYDGYFGHNATGTFFLVPRIEDATHYSSYVEAQQAIKWYKSRNLRLLANDFEIYDPEKVLLLSVMES